MCVCVCVCVCMFLYYNVVLRGRIFTIDFNWIPKSKLERQRNSRVKGGGRYLVLRTRLPPLTSHPVGHAEV